MDVNGEYIFDAPQEITWKALLDPEVLSSIMPGGEDFKEIGKNEYAGLLNIKVGPVQGKFKGTIKLSDIVAPESYQMDVDGSGAPGFVKAKGSLQLTGQDDKTHMAYEGTAQVGGRIASVGQRLLESSAKSIIRQSLEGLNEYLKVQVAAQTSGDTASPTADEDEKSITDTGKPGYAPPSQTEIAINVAKDVVGDVIPSRYRPVVIAIAVILVIFLLYLILS
jgi:carbon monoxide dehydrogenase subunit G